MAEKDSKISTPALTRDQMFLASEVFPDAVQGFLSPSVQIAQARDQADVVLDASALLLPYKSGSESLREVSELFDRLVKQKRLFIPAQASREFIRNRPNKLSELQQGLLDKMSTLVIPELLSYPILEGLPQYKTLLDHIQQATQLRSDIRKATLALVEAVRDWEWNDPVSVAYRGVIKPEVIVECACSQEEIEKEVLRRYDLGIPPGYKDATKTDGGVGDYLIWKTILEIGSKNKRPLIFVSGDEKADWQHSSKGTAFLPRVELLTEYKTASGGKMFYMIPLSRLLELFDGESAFVTELQQAEESVNEVDVEVTCPSCSVPVSTKLGLSVGSSATPVCTNCRHRFHVNRSRDGVLARRKGITRTNQVPPELSSQHEEIEFCPNCKNLIEFPFAKLPGTAHWVQCHECQAENPARRAKDGSIAIGRPSVQSLPPS